MFRIATFNIENLGGKEQILLEERIQILRPTLLRFNADILCLQEINSEKIDKDRTLFSLKKLIEGTIYESYQVSHTLGVSGQHLSDKHNLVTLSKYPIIDENTIFHDFLKGPSYGYATVSPPLEKQQEIVWDRPLLYTKIQLPSGLVLHILNLHLRAPLAALVKGQKKDQAWQSNSGWAEGYYVASMKRAGQALEARILVDKIFNQDKQALIAVCGDFNAEEYEDACRILITSEEDTSSAHLALFSLIPVEHSIEKSRRFSVLHQGRAQMVDHILISRELYGLYQNCEVHNEIIGDELSICDKNGQIASSNHAPLVAQFNI